MNMRFLFLCCIIVAMNGCKPNYVVDKEVDYGGFKYIKNDTYVGEAYVRFSIMQDTATVIMEVRDWVNNDHWFTRERLVIEGVSPYRDVKYYWEGEPPIQYSYKMYGRENGKEVCSYTLDKTMPQAFTSYTEIETNLYGDFDNYFVKDSLYSNNEDYPDVIHLSEGYYEAVRE